MNILTHFVSRFRDVILLTFYILISFVLMLSSDSAIVEGLRSSTLFSIGILQDNIHSLDDYLNLKSKNERLRSQNTRLAYENFQLQDALIENIRLRKLLGFKYRADLEYIPAKVIGSSPQSFVTGFLVASKANNRIQKNSAVMVSSGLVGKIVKRSAGYAICQNLLDPNSRVSVRIQRNRELGFVVWDGGSGLLLENVPNTVKVKAGDVLFTSGMSKIYPANIKVGYVTGVQTKNEQLFQVIKVKPAVNFNNLEEVFIIRKTGENES